MPQSKNKGLGASGDFSAHKDLFEGVDTDRPGRTVNLEVIRTNWSGQAQAYMKPFIVTAIDTGGVSNAADIREAHLEKYGGTVAVVLAEGAHGWASLTRYHYYAKYGGVYIGIWSSD